MAKRNWRLRLGAIALALSCAVVAPAAAQKVDKNEQKRQKEMQEAMQREARPVVLVVNEWQKQGGGDAQALMVNPKETDPTKAAVAATPAVDAKSFTWRYDLMKAADGKVYVPYTMTVPAEAIGGGGPVSVYLRVVQKGSQPATDGKTDQKDANPYPFEDFFTVEPRPAAAGLPPRIMRAFAAPPGEYDVYFGLRAKPADPKKRDEQPIRVVAVKQNVELPNFWDGQFTTSSVVITAKVDTVQGQVSPEMQRDRPYLFGQTEFVPSPDNKFKKTDELSVLFQIYNPGLEGGKPNVTIEYSFHQKLAEGEKYFNKTSPQQLNGETLPPTFDVATTQMLPGGQSVPLASFPVGDYRMEIKITDAVSKKTITRDVAFSVLGA
jgi:hypothetical protein